MGYTGLVYNVGAKKCLTAPTSDGLQMYVSNCDPNSTKQKITISGTRLTTEYRDNNEGKINTYDGNVYWSGQDGTGNDIDFHFEPQESGYDIDNGTFRFYGWGKQGGHYAAVGSDLKVTQKLGLDGSDQSKWIPYSLAVGCQTLNVSDPCTAEKYALVKNGGVQPTLPPVGGNPVTTLPATLKSTTAPPAGTTSPLTKAPSTTKPPTKKANNVWIYVVVGVVIVIIFIIVIVILLANKNK